MKRQLNGKEIKKSDFLTIPNILTYIRLLLIIPFMILFFRDNYIGAAVCIICSGLTDCFDGFFARRLNQVTNVGKILDPIADKFTLISVVICLVHYAPSVLPILIILIIKDVSMLFGGSILINKGLTPPAAKWYGKVGTVLFYFSVCVIVFLKAAFNYENGVLNFVLLFVTACAMLFALYKYAKIFFSILKNEKTANSDNEKPENE